MKKSTFKSNMCIRCFSKDEKMTDDQICSSCAEQMQNRSQDNTELLASLPVEEDIEDLSASIPQEDIIPFETCKVDGCDEMAFGEGYCQDCGEAENEARFESYLDFLHSE